MPPSRQRIVLQYGGGKNRLSIPSNAEVLRHTAFLRQLHNALRFRKIEQAIAILQRASDNEIQALAEMAQNALQGKYPQEIDVLREKLKPDKTLLRALCRGDVPLKLKRQKIIRALKSRIQRGGALPLIPILAPLLGSLLSSLVAKSL